MDATVLNKHDSCSLKQILPREEESYMWNRHPEPKFSNMVCWFWKASDDQGRSENIFPLLGLLQTNLGLQPWTLRPSLSPPTSTGSKLLCHSSGWRVFRTGEEGWLRGISRLSIKQKERKTCDMSCLRQRVRYSDISVVLNYELDRVLS